MLNNQKLKSTWSKFLLNDVLKGEKYCYTLTATYRNSANISKRKVEKDVIHFKNVLDRQVLGNRYRKHGIRLPGFLVVEGRANGTHYHIHGCIKYHDLRQQMKFKSVQIEKCWKDEIDFAGQIEVKPSYDLGSWIDYTLKDRSKEGDFSDAVQTFKKYPSDVKATQLLVS